MNYSMDRIWKICKFHLEYTFHFYFQLAEQNFYCFPNRVRVIDAGKVHANL